MSCRILGAPPNVDVDIDIDINIDINIDIDKHPRRARRWEGVGSAILSNQVRNIKKYHKKKKSGRSK